MDTKKKPAKDKIKAKAKAVKDKVKAKVKASTALIAALMGIVFVSGCSTATPASRATTATYTFNFNFPMDEGAKGNNVNITNTMGDGALASADSSGSTETQTATPTVDVRPDVDVHYNDAIAGASTASRGVIESLAEVGKAKVLSMIESKATGTVEVQKKDGTTATVECSGGQCSFVTK